MTDLLWVREQMSLRKLANQFLTKVKNTGVNRVLITSVNKGDGKARFMSELAVEMSRVNQELVPLAAANLHIVSPERFKEKLVVVYGPAYFEAEGLHTIPERWMRAFDAVVVIVMARKTRSRDLAKLVHWLEDYNYENIWPILNEKRAPDLSESWLRLKGKIGPDRDKIKRISRGSAAAVWQPLLSPMEEMSDLPALPAADSRSGVVTIEEIKQSTGDSSKGRYRGQTPSSPPIADGDVLLDDLNHTATLKGQVRRDGSASASSSPPPRVESNMKTIISSVPPPSMESTRKPSEPPPPKSAMKTMIGVAPPAKSHSSEPPPSRKDNTPTRGDNDSLDSQSPRDTLKSSVPPSTVKPTSNPPMTTPANNSKKER